MYNSIQHFNEFGVSKIEKVIETFVAEKKDLADLVLGLQESLFELGRNIVAEVLEDMDDHIRNSAERKKRYEIVGGKMILQSHGKEIFHCPISRFFLPQ